MITPEMPPTSGDFDVNASAETLPAKPAALPMEDCVPMEALAMPDAEDQMQPPSVGDVVNYQVTGKISRIEGGQAYVTKQTVNGQEVTPEPDADDAGGPSDGDADNVDKLTQDAQAMSAAGGY